MLHRTLRPQASVLRSTASYGPVTEWSALTAHRLLRARWTSGQVLTSITTAHVRAVVGHYHCAIIIISGRVAGHLIVGREEGLRTGWQRRRILEVLWTRSLTQAHHLQLLLLMLVVMS